MIISHFLFPKICSHCQILLQSKEKLFCNPCATYLEPLNPKFRCDYCFKEHEKRLCDICCKKKKNLIPIGAVWEEFGPAATFIQKLHRDKFPSFIKLATSFLIIQYQKLSFPMPDFIIPVPKYKLHFLWNGNSLNTLIAKNLSKSLGIPIAFPLSTNMLDEDNFYLKKRADIEGKSILILDAQVFTRNKWENLHEVITQADPEKICGLVLAISPNA